MKHVVIVGGTKGLGRVLASEYNKAGVGVSVIGRTKPEPAESGVTYCLADLGDSGARLAALEQAVAANGPIDSMIFSHRYRGQGDTWVGEMEVGLTATRDLMEASLDKLAPDGCRSFVLLGSVAGLWIASEQGAGYHVAKAGMETLIRYYAVRWGPSGVRVNGVAPCAFIKPESRQYHTDNPAASERMAKLTPLGRMGTAEESAAAVRFFAGNESRFITGQNLIVDGGLTLQLQTSLG